MRIGLWSKVDMPAPNPKNAKASLPIMIAMGYGNAVKEDYTAFQ
jgi:hypothetical protein